MFNLFKKKTITYPKEVEAFLLQAVEATNKQQAEVVDAYKLGNYDNWDVDLSSGTLQFSNSANPAAVLTVDVQVVGTLTVEGKTFKWASDNPSIPSALTRVAQQTKDWCVQQGLSSLAAESISLEEEDVAKLVAAANVQSGSKGMYRAKGERVIVYLLFQEFHEG